MLERGFVIAGARLIKHAWQIYVAHVPLFVVYIAEIGYLAQRYNDSNLENEFNVANFMRYPAETLYQGLILSFKSVNMDVLPLLIAPMLVFPPVVDDAAAIESDTRGIFPALSCCASLQLELIRLSDRFMVFQPAR